MKDMLTVHMGEKWEEEEKKWRTEQMAGNQAHIQGAHGTSTMGLGLQQTSFTRKSIGKKEWISYMIRQCLCLYTRRATGLLGIKSLRMIRQRWSSRWFGYTEVRLSDLIYWFNMIMTYSMTVSTITDIQTQLHGTFTCSGGCRYLGLCPLYAQGDPALSQYLLYVNKDEMEWD